MCLTFLNFSFLICEIQTLALMSQHSCETYMEIQCEKYLTNGRTYVKRQLENSERTESWNDNDRLSQHISARAAMQCAVFVKVMGPPGIFLCSIKT